jgi:hypothetical protein
LEKPSVTYKLEDGGYLTIPIIWPGETPCENNMGNAPLPAGPPNSKLAAWQHTHPFSPSDLLPRNCHDSTDTNRYRYSTAYGGPSQPDWAVAANVPPFNTVPGYIQDKKFIYKFKGGLHDSSEWNAKNVRRIKRKFLDDPSCL